MIVLAGFLAVSDVLGRETALTNTIDNPMLGTGEI